MSITEHVKINPSGEELANSVMLGTVHATIDGMQFALGPQHSDGDGVTTSVAWFLETPAGRVTIRDHHTLPSDRLSVAAGDYQAASYAMEYLSTFGLKYTLEKRK